MYYLGFLKDNTKDVVIFKSLVKPKRGDFSYFLRVMGPYQSEKNARTGLRTLKRAYGEYGYQENPTPESRAQYCRERQISPGAFAAGSFRTILLGASGKKGVVACPKGRYKRGRCGVGTKLQTILHPVGSRGCPTGGLELKKRTRNVMSRTKALKLTKQILSFGKEIYHTYREKNPGKSYHDQKFLMYMRDLDKYIVGSAPYIATLAKAYEHLKSAKDSMREESVR
jgi:hypothetical protein